MVRRGDGWEQWRGRSGREGKGAGFDYTLSFPEVLISGTSDGEDLRPLYFAGTGFHLPVCNLIQHDMRSPQALCHKLNFSSCTNLDYSNTTSKFCQAFIEFF